MARDKYNTVLSPAMVDTVKDLPISERPRERLIAQGVGALSDAELLAVILRVGSKHQHVVELSKHMLKRFSLKEMSQISLDQFRQFRGVSTAKACQLVACFELSRRIFAPDCSERVAIQTSRDVADLLVADLGFRKKELFIGLYLDSRNVVLKQEVISMGGLNSSIVHPREVFKTALEVSANSIILAHNHPSQDPKPSQDDILITKKIVDAGRIMGIPILDHVVIGGQRHVSMADQDLVLF